MCQIHTKSMENVEVSQVTTIFSASNTSLVRAFLSVHRGRTFYLNLLRMKEANTEDYDLPKNEGMCPRILQKS